MTFVRTGWRLGYRRPVLVVAVFAAILSGLGSCVMQELAYSQRVSYRAQVAFAGRLAAACREQPQQGPSSCLERRGIDPSAVALYRHETDALGARARALQTAAGALAWTQSWLVTLLGLAALVVAVTVTTAGDLEARRLVTGWHPARAGHRPLLVAGIAGVASAALVTLGAAGGSLVATVIGGHLWPLASEPRQIALPGLGGVALEHPTAGWVVAWASVVAAVVLIGWLAQRTLVAILGGCGVFAVLALLSDTLPAWFPWTALPSTSGMWLHHRGEVADLWRWPVQQDAPSGDWASIAASDPRLAALAGAGAVLCLVAIAVPWVIRRTID